MCVAIEEMRMDSWLEGWLEGKLEARLEGELEGEIKGAVKTYKEVGFSLQETIWRVADRYNFALEESEEKVTEYRQ